jgi:hypothetical protein
MIARNCAILLAGYISYCCCRQFTGPVIITHFVVLTDAAEIGYTVFGCFFRYRLLAEQLSIIAAVKKFAVAVAKMPPSLISNTVMSEQPLLLAETEC